MRDLLAHADLARYAGQFVWLDLSYDEPRNRDFMSKYGASATPTFFVIDPQRAVVAMKRDVLFVRTVVAGMWCLTRGGPADWMDSQKTLQLLAEETLSLPITVRDHRDSIYRTLMFIAVARKDNSTALKWGDRWLAELDQIRPRSNDERSAIDIARVENLQIIGDPARILPALRASEKAMPGNYIASLRLAEIEVAAQQYEKAIATCQRGLARRPGAFAKTWLLEIEAEALEKKDDRRKLVNYFRRL